MILGPDDRLPAPPQRVLVAGASGVGKTTLARRITAAWQLPHTEIDALFHGPGWRPRPEFDAEVAALAASDRWVTEWMYPSARPVLAARADLMLWLDLPRLLALRRVVRRTVRRRVRREQLWNGNREPALRTILTDPEHIVRWSWTTHPLMAERVRALPADLPVVRLRSQREIDRWVRSISCAAR